MSLMQLLSRKAQLEGKLQEQEELELLRQDPINLNPDQESVRRLKVSASPYNSCEAPEFPGQGGFAYARAAM